MNREGGFFPAVCVHKVCFLEEWNPQEKMRVSCGGTPPLLKGDVCSSVEEHCFSIVPGDESSIS